MVMLVNENRFVNRQSMFENDVQMFENRSYITMRVMLMDLTNRLLSNREDNVHNWKESDEFVDQED